MNKMTIRVILKSGSEFAIKCDKLHDQAKRLRTGDRIQH